MHDFFGTGFSFYTNLADIPVHRNTLFYTDPALVSALEAQEETGHLGHRYVQFDLPDH